MNVENFLIKMMCKNIVRKVDLMKQLKLFGIFLLSIFVISTENFMVHANVGK